jgi:hypothetical protein
LAQSPDPIGDQGTRGERVEIKKRKERERVRDKERKRKREIN